MIRAHRWLWGLLGVVWPLASAAAPDVAAGLAAADHAVEAGLGAAAVHMDPMVRAMERGAHNARAFMTGPDYAIPATPADLTCEQIYERIVQLTPQTYNYRPAFWEDPRNGALVALSWVFTPSYYLLAYSGVAYHGEQQSIGGVNRQIDALRRASARKDCWVR
jgi:hypothetical protein